MQFCSCWILRYPRNMDIFKYYLLPRILAHTTLTSSKFGIFELGVAEDEVLKSISGAGYAALASQARRAGCWCEGGEERNLINQFLVFHFQIIRESNRAVSAAGLWFWCGGEGEEGDGAVPPAHALRRSHPPPDPHSWSLIARISQIAAPSYNSLSYVTLFKHHHFPPSGTYKSLEE